MRLLAGVFVLSAIACSGVTRTHPRPEDNDPPDAACVPDSNDALCADSCGTISVVDNCGIERKVTCSPCACMSQSSASFCADHGAECGTSSGKDSCGKSRTVDCGSCTGDGVTCQQNQCVCLAETDDELCQQSFLACGSWQGVDRCGAMRTWSCGSCATGNACDDKGVCACNVTESDAAFCARYGASCGTASGIDKCGNPRVAASCGSCAGATTCGGGGKPNQCGCTPASDADVCALNARTCGSASLTDNCGKVRVVGSCGSCTQPDVCSASGQCACNAESDLAFCARLGKNCDMVTAPDNCGVTRSVSCGASCPTGQTCGGGGSAHVCGCTGQTTSALCTAYAVSCGPFSVVDACGMTRTLDCGGCGSGLTCGANGMVGVCSPPRFLDPHDSHPVSIAPAYIDPEILAMKAVSATEVWLASRHALVRIKDGVVTVYFVDGLTNEMRFWASAPNDVYLTTNSAQPLHFDGAAWSRVDAGFSSTSALVTVTGTSKDDVWLATVSTIRHWNGAAWSSWTAPTGTQAITDIVARDNATPYVSRGSDIFRWNGLSYVQLPAMHSASASGARRMWISPSGSLVVVAAVCASTATSYLERFDGVAWTSLGNATGGSYCRAKPSIIGTTDSDFWWGDFASAGHHYTTAASTTIAGYMFDTAGSAVFAASGSRLYSIVNGQLVTRFDGGSFGSCTSLEADGAGGAWLNCGGRLGRVDAQGVFSYPTPLTASNVTAVSRGSLGSLWMTLASGAIEWRSATGTTTFNDFAGSALVAIDGTSDSDMWIVTEEGGAARWNGSTWTSSMIPIAGSKKIVGLWAAGGTTLAWTLGELFKWTGTAWISITTPVAGYEIENAVAQGTTIWLEGYYNGAEVAALSGTSWVRFAGSSRMRVDATGVIGLSTTGYLQRWDLSGPKTVSVMKLYPEGAWTVPVDFAMLSSNAVVYRGQGYLYAGSSTQNGQLYVYTY